MKCENSVKKALKMNQNNYIVSKYLKIYLFLNCFHCNKKNKTKNLESISLNTLKASTENLIFKMFKIIYYFI
jgi:hypothetical protein